MLPTPDNSAAQMVGGQNDLQDTALHILYKHLLSQPTHVVNEMINNAYKQPTNPSANKPTSSWSI